MNRQQSYRLGGRGRGGCPGGLAAGGEGAEQLVEEAPAGGRGDRQRGGGDGEDGGDPGEAEEGLERGPDSRLHSSAATQRGAAETGAQARGRGLRKRRRGAAEAGTCVRRGLGGLGLCFGLGVAAGLGKANLEDARNSLDSLVRFLPVAGRF